MRGTVLLSAAMAMGIGVAASAQMVESPGFWINLEGTLTACDTNPFFGGTDYPFVEREDVPWGVDLDPDYDWMIMETMVGTPVHGHPYYQWPANAPLGDVPFGTHEMGYAMGILYVFRDTNGFDPGNWGSGRLLLRVAIGMSHQDYDGHSSLSWWTDWSDPNTPPWDNRFRGVAAEDPAGRWANRYGPGWIIEGHGITTECWEVAGRRTLDWYSDGFMERFSVTPLRERHGDMNLQGTVEYGDVELFMAQFDGSDHDPDRHLIADYNEDGEVDLYDFNMFMWDLLGSG